jgi:hypothetical protein
VVELLLVVEAVAGIAWPMRAARKMTRKKIDSELSRRKRLMLPS